MLGCLNNPNCFGFSFFTGSGPTDYGSGCFKNGCDCENGWGYGGYDYYDCSG